MARSLTVKHDEVPSTSPLFTAFLLLAFGWMAASAAVAVAQDMPPGEAPVLYAE